MKQNINGFELQEPPLKGGMGIVYKGTKGFLSHAFKLVRPDKAANNPRLCQQILKEIKFLAKLNGHPNIVQVIDVHTHQDMLGHPVTAIEMEWLEGRTVEDFIKTKAPNGLSEKDIIKIVKQLLSGLGYAHSQNILHLDLKPSNVFICDTNYTKIIDFGIARVVGDNAEIIEGAQKMTKLTETGESTFKGTLAYSSPEQQVGGKLGVYSDIYSLGKTIHFMCTGTDDPAADISYPKLAAIVDKCTQNNPKHRYQSCKEVECALDKDVEILPPPGPNPEPKIKVCPKCKTENPSDARFCKKCKYDLSQPYVETPSPNGYYCKTCGHKWIDVFKDGKTKFCPRDGSSNIERIYIK